MKKCKLIFKWLMIVGFANTINGCYSFYSISQGEYLNEKVDRRIKIVLKNKEEILIENPRHNLKLERDKILIIEGDTIKIKISIDDIEKIQEVKFSFGKTFFATMWITVGTLFLTLLILVAIYGPIRFG